MTQDEKDKLAMFAGMAVQAFFRSSRKNSKISTETLFDIAEAMLADYKKRTEDKEIKQVEKSLSLQQIIDSLKLNYVNENITEVNFPTQPLRGEYKLFKFDKEMTARKIEEEIAKAGYLPANLYELLDYEKNHINNYDIVAFGSSWVSPVGGRCVPFLDGGASERRLGLDWGDPGVRWNAYDRFLAVSK